MTTFEHRAVIGTSNSNLAAEMTGSAQTTTRRVRFSVCTTLAEFRGNLESEPAAVAVLDDSLLGRAPIAETLLHLTESCPLIVVAAPWRQTDFARGIAEGDIEFVATVGDYVALAAAFISRRVRWADLAESNTGLPWRQLPPDFGSILRHEINNPLTGILGNAELLLTSLREKVPASSLQRLETVVDLAVRLRETTRRLSNACERESDHAHARTA
jgi:signal transduction histidine kinase